MPMCSIKNKPKGKKALRNKWVYRLKQGDGRNPPKFKAHIAVKGFQQEMGVDFDKIFTPIVNLTSIRMMLSIAATMDLEVE